MNCTFISNLILGFLIFPTSSQFELVTVDTLLTQPERFHEKHVRVRGVVSQPEMHLDESGLFFDFVFVLKEGNHSLIVFGQHDRTQGSSSIVMGARVEVSGRFWKDRKAHDHHFENNLEAMAVSPYPPLTPDRAGLKTPNENCCHKTLSIRSAACLVPSHGINSVGIDNLCTCSRACSHFPVLNSSLVSSTALPYR